MLQKHWTAWLILALGLTGCKTGGLTPTWSNPLAFLMPKKTSEPEKPSSLATPTPPKAGYSSADDQATAKSKSPTSRTSQLGTSPPSSSPAAWNTSSESSSSLSRNRYGGNMAYGSPAEGPSSAAGMPNAPYGSPPLGQSNSMSGSRYGISPQVGRYDAGPASATNPPLSASRTNAAGYGYGYGSRDFSSAASSADRYGGSYTGTSPNAPNWRSWESVSGPPSTSSVDTLGPAEGYERSSSWAGRSVPSTASSRRGSEAAWEDRTGPSSPPPSWASSADSSSSSFSAPSRAGYGSPARSAEGTLRSSSSSGSDNPYFSDPSRSSGQDSPPDSRRLSARTSDNSPAGTGSARTGAMGGPAGGRLGTSDWEDSASRPSATGDSGYRVPQSEYQSGETGYRPGNTGYRPGDTGYRPGDTGYQPGQTGYRPGQTGYNPPNTPPYQMPAGGSGYSSSTSSGEYRPGSTRSYTPGQPF